MPYWTTDIAGYGSPYERDTHDPAYQELYTRWYQFGVFCPIFRTHGHRANEENELFSYGPATPTLISYDKLRYRLLPYIYSLAWKVTSDDYTIMRPLVMDWRTNEKVWNIGDQFMFGPAILVSPVTLEGATERYVYLPPARALVRLLDREIHQRRSALRRSRSSRSHTALRQGRIDPAPRSRESNTPGRCPVPIELRIYRGADGHFDLMKTRATAPLREGRALSHPHRLERIRAEPHHRRARRQLSQHASRAQVQRCLCRRKPRSG